ncbi:hypothetical protein FHS15_004317 [Paenibacillus castaneae]|uniref:hypothetical protein n=1 Tax=Paenibacillus castaneae TaxID=474957 RepID=UPI000C999CA7|nr:hypothetical protein [Paenibacillus castaneae]NIK79159.1 hypothetical protein [Paenibacillus castaneae]
MNTIFIAILILILLVNRQLKPRPIKGNVFFLPLLLILFASYQAYQAGVEGGEGISLLLGAGMGLGVGWLQGRFTAVYQKNGIWMTVGSIWSIAIWLLSVPIRLIIKYGFVELMHINVHLTGEYAFAPILLSLGAIVLGRALYLISRYPLPLREAAGTTRYERRRARKSRMHID